MNIEAARAHSDMFRGAPALPSAGALALVHRAAIVALLARRAIYLVALARVAPQAVATIALASSEIALIDRMTGGATTALLSDALAKLGRLGGASQATPRFTRTFAVARGLSRIADFQIAARLRAAKYSERS